MKLLNNNQNENRELKMKRKKYRREFVHRGWFRERDSLHKKSGRKTLEGL